MPRFKVDPRDVPPAGAARRLGLTEAAFRKHLPALQRRGFPAPDLTTGFYDLVAIERWMDERHGLAPGAQDASKVAPARIAKLMAELPDRKPPRRRS